MRISEDFLIYAEIFANFAIGELANLTPDERMAYISSLDRKRDYVNTIAFAKKEALEEGIELGIEQGLEKARAKAEAKNENRRSRCCKTALTIS